jgi:hypothetical protein
MQCAPSIDRIGVEQRADGLVNIASLGVPPKLDATHRAFSGSDRGGRSEPGEPRRGMVAGLRSDPATIRGVRTLGGLAALPLRVVWLIVSVKRSHDYR